MAEKNSPGSEFAGRSSETRIPGVPGRSLGASPVGVHYIHTAYKHTIHTEATRRLGSNLGNLRRPRLQAVVDNNPAERVPGFCGNECSGCGESKRVWPARDGHSEPNRFVRDVGADTCGDGVADARGRRIEPGPVSGHRVSFPHLSVVLMQ